ncbi:MAG: hypothetical protein IVW57_16875, partial [Ktedonobacterales bacterium]|nr:hypothetical protein [Ktedonobacterales bacterium]
MTIPGGSWEQGQAHYAQLLREAERERLLNEADGYQSTLRARTLHRVGAFLVACGQRLDVGPW